MQNELSLFAYKEVHFWRKLYVETYFSMMNLEHNEKVKKDFLFMPIAEMKKVNPVEFLQTLINEHVKNEYIFKNVDKKDDV